MRWEQCCMVFWPGIIVISLFSSFGALTFFHAIPKIMQLDHVPIVIFPVEVLFALSYVMFLWCWIYTATCDPGRTRDDLAARGLLEQVLRGDIPPCLRSLPICQKCMLPKPKGSEHCEDCDHCVLRYDHHCGVIGACIADKNTKSFVLTLTYAFTYGLSNAILTFYGFATGKQAALDVLSLVAGIYSLVMGLSLLGFGISTICEGMGTGEIDKISGRTRKARWSRYMMTFGDRWWKRIIPIQKRTTFLAWPGISWDNDPVNLV